MEHLNLWLVGVEGILSFLSPCILPLLPVYVSILANSTTEDMKVLIKNTLGFVIGISTTFFLLGMSIYTVGSFFKDYQNVLTLVGGMIIIVMGLFYMGVIRSNLLNTEKRFHMKTGQMNLISSFVLGFTFSFGWTPCIGPTLASVLVMASTSNSRVTALFLILVYTLGFTVPFLILAIFYKKLSRSLNQIKKHMLLIKKVGGIILIIAGLSMLVTGAKQIVSQQRQISGEVGEDVRSEEDTAFQDINQAETTDEAEQNTEAEENKLEAIDFELYDQYGNIHKLSNYEGKVVFLNFWATWCPPCVGEMPYIDELYKEYGENNEEVIILGIANPNLGQEVDKESIIEFLDEQGYTFPVVFDTEYNQIFSYGFNSFPSTLIIDKEGYINLYVPGAMDKQMMKQIIEQAK
ncbi:MAG: redoxin family protein [Cellulosilyticum sp.]|nr:redoxin family protein [Cellulosilyticum sp.]